MHTPSWLRNGGSSMYEKPVRTSKSIDVVVNDDYSSKSLLDKKVMNSSSYIPDSSDYLIDRVNHGSILEGYFDGIKSYGGAFKRLL